MAFVVGVIGVAVIGVAVHDNHSEYSCHSRHSDHRQYNDAALVEQIKNKEEEVRRKVSDVESLRRQMERDFNSRVAELKREKDYPTFYSAQDSSPSKIINSVKDDMRRELDKELWRDRQELEAIDRMIARINELELQAPQNLTDDMRLKIANRNSSEVLRMLS